MNCEAARGISLPLASALQYRCTDCVSVIFQPPCPVWRTLITDVAREKEPTLSTYRCHFASGFRNGCGYLVAPTGYSNFVHRMHGPSWIYIAGRNFPRLQLQQHQHQHQQAIVALAAPKSVGLDDSSELSKTSTTYS
ncbi:hypothetical protein Mapa_009018 [Marchantia paleacea]|nr:hypothetical protein Mapa_009018 [Marchantia paleacea]